MLRLMDSDGSGDLDYDEFIDAFVKAQGQDLRIYLMMTRLQCNYVAQSVNRIKSEMGIDPAGEEQIEASVPRKASLASASTAASTPEATNLAPVPTAEAAPAASPAAVSFEADFRGINEKLSQQFEQLARRIELNTMTLAQQSEVLEVSGPESLCLRTCPAT